MRESDGNIIYVISEYTVAQQYIEFTRTILNFKMDNVLERASSTFIIASAPGNVTSANKRIAIVNLARRVGLQPIEEKYFTKNTPVTAHEPAWQMTPASLVPPVPPMG